MQDILPEPGVDPGDARRAADDIVSGAAFRADESLLDRAAGVLDDALARVLSQLTTGGAGSIVAIALFVAMVVVLALMARQWGGVGPARLRRAPAVTVSPRDDDGPARTAAQWRDEARRCQAVGDLDGAVRARYRAVLADLIEDGTLDDVPATTSGEYVRRLLATGHPDAVAFDELTTLFEDIWYGPRTATPADIERFDLAERRLAEGPAAAAGVPS